MNRLKVRSHRMCGVLRYIAATALPGTAKHRNAYDVSEGFRGFRFFGRPSNEYREWTPITRLQSGVGSSLHVTLTCYNHR